MQRNTQSPFAITTLSARRDGFNAWGGRAGQMSDESAFSRGIFLANRKNLKSVVDECIC